MQHIIYNTDTYAKKQVYSLVDLSYICCIRIKSVFAHAVFGEIHHVFYCCLYFNI